MSESEVFVEVESVTQGEIAARFKHGEVHYVCTRNRVFWVGVDNTRYGLVIFKEVFMRKGLEDGAFCLNTPGKKRGDVLRPGYELVFWRVPTKTPLQPGHVVAVVRAPSASAPSSVMAELRTRYSLTSRHGRQPRSPA